MHCTIRNQSVCLLTEHVDMQQRDVGCLQVENLLQYTEQDGCEVAIEWSPNARLRNPGPHTSKTDSLEEGRKVSDIMDFLDAISQQVLQTAQEADDDACCLTDIAVFHQTFHMIFTGRSGGSAGC